MRDVFARLYDRMEFGHQVVISISLLSALLSIRQNIGLHWTQQVLNPLSGFAMACLAGFIAMEMGIAPWLCGGFAYIMGHVGNKIMDTILVALKIAERDPIKFAASVIALIWQYIIPPTNNNGSK